MKYYLLTVVGYGVENLVYVEATSKAQIKKDEMKFLTMWFGEKRPSGHITEILQVTKKQAGRARFSFY